MAATPATVDDAVAELLRAVGAVEDLAGLRLGVMAGAYAMQSSVARAPSAPAELEQVIDVWIGLDAVIAAVAGSRSTEEVASR